MRTCDAAGKGGEQMQSTEHLKFVLPWPRVVAPCSIAIAAVRPASRPGRRLRRAGGRRWVVPGPGRRAGGLPLGRGRGTERPGVGPGKPAEQWQASRKNAPTQNDQPPKWTQQRAPAPPTPWVIFGGVQLGGRGSNEKLGVI